MLGRSTKAQDGCKPTNRDRILSAVSHPSDSGAVLVEEECRIELQDHFFIPITPKCHYLLEPMVLKQLNDISESWTVFLVLL
jgi:hypothetical protein